MAYAGSRAAFTLIEAMVVVILMSIIAVSVMPALNNLDEARRGAAADELIRLLSQARALAMASGRPMGVSVDLEDNAARIVQIAAAGAAPTPATDPMGQPEAPVRFADQYAGVELVSMTQGDGTAGSGSIWFRFDGVPQTRGADGALVGAFTQDATVELSGSQVVTVRMGTGLVE
ncbi:MAG: Tfp pilus assembly protein FimT/FimU [Phycisphaerales bacterium JB059]